MIVKAIKAGSALAGYTDARLWRGMVWSAIDGLSHAAIFVAAYALLLNAANERTSISTIAAITGVMAALLLVRYISIAGSTRNIFGGATAMMADARLRVADHMRKLPLGWYKQQRLGELSATIASDFKLVEDIWSHMIAQLIGSIVMPLAVIAWLFWIDWHHALIAAAGLPFAGFAVLIAVRAVIAGSEKTLSANASAHADVLEYINGIATIRSFGQTGPQLDKVVNSLKAMRQAALRIELRPTPGIAIFGMALEAGFVLFVWFAAKTSESGHDHWLIFAVMCLPAYRRLFDLGVSCALMRYTSSALARIDGVLQQPLMSEGKLTAVPMDHQIVFDQVKFTYPDEPSDKPLFNGLTFRIKPNACTVIVGHSGSGKTTLIQLIARLWDVDGGHISIGGINVRSFTTDALHQMISMVFQEVVLVQGTVAQNLQLARPGASLEQMRVACRQAGADDFIMALPEQYEALIGENGGRLSGGERQRLSLARAFLKDAPILLLDEVTASVDPSSEKQIRRAIAKLSQKRTVIIVSHRLRIASLADEIIVVDDGRIAEQGNHTALIRNDGIYAQLHACARKSQHWQLLADQPENADGNI